MWLKVEARFPNHKKVEQMATRCNQDTVDRILGLWLRAACWSAANLTDGFVPSWFVRTKHQRGCAAELIDAGLWHQVDGGYQIHDFLNYNYSKEQIDRFREMGKTRQDRFREGGRNAGVTPLHAEPVTPVSHRDPLSRIHDVDVDLDANKDGDGTKVDPIEARRREIEEMLQ